MERVDCVVIGGGVVGLATARRLALDGHEVLILEREAVFGAGISARNSEVVHAGIYYPPGSLKAQLCVRGRELLYRFCEQHAVAHARCGKLIVAQSDQLSALSALQQRARHNGVSDLRWLEREQVRALEPELECAGALLSPSTGIIDSHGLMRALLSGAESAGALIAYLTPVERLIPSGTGITVCSGGNSPMELSARCVVNASGLSAATLAASAGAITGYDVPRQFYAKGSYFALSGRNPFSHLVYPLPESAGLGIHLTLDLMGRARFGPDVEWIEEPDYGVDPGRAVVFAEAIRRYWPGLPDGALSPDYAGVRPKLSPAHQSTSDFRIDTPREHGIAGLIHLLGIESPGLTASLAIADRVAALARRDIFAA